MNPPDTGRGNTWFHKAKGAVVTGSFLDVHNCSQQVVATLPSTVVNQPVPRERCYVSQTHFVQQKYDQAFVANAVHTFILSCSQFINLLYSL